MTSAHKIGLHPGLEWNSDLSELPYGLKPNHTAGSQVEEVASGTWRLSIPAGKAGRYRLAQIDNYTRLKRRDFPHRAPLLIDIAVRASDASLPGTWGVGLWNDPFAMGALAGTGLRLPTLPNTAWFFFASPQNYLSLWDDLAANGMMAAAFQAKAWAGLAAFGAPALPLLLVPATARLLRRLARGFVLQDAAAIDSDLRAWHSYRLEWQIGSLKFWADGQPVLETKVSPKPPLGLVIWIDNQYAAFAPQGRLRYGMLENPESAWIEVRRLEIEG